MQIPDDEFEKCTEIAADIGSLLMKHITEKEMSVFQVELSIAMMQAYIGSLVQKIAEDNNCINEPQDFFAEIKQMAEQMHKDRQDVPH